MGSKVSKHHQTYRQLTQKALTRTLHGQTAHIRTANLWPVAERSYWTNLSAHGLVLRARL